MYCVKIISSRLSVLCFSLSLLLIPVFADAQLRSEKVVEATIRDLVSESAASFERFEIPQAEQKLNKARELAREKGYLPPVDGREEVRREASNGVDDA